VEDPKMVNRNRKTSSTWLRLIVLGLLVVGGLSAQTTFGSFSWTGSPSNPTASGGDMYISPNAEAQASVTSPGTITLSWAAYTAAPGNGGYYIQTAPGSLTLLGSGGGTITEHVTGGSLILLYTGSPTPGNSLEITKAQFQAVPFDAGFGVPLCAAFGFAIPAVKRLRKRNLSQA
jgi:hypothetical protein